MPALFVSPYMLTIILLIGSNTFMTTAWYWHLRFRDVPLCQVPLISWGLALFEYCLACRQTVTAVTSIAPLCTKALPGTR